MKSSTFKILRISRKISAKQIAKKLGYISKTPVLDAEKLETMPNVFVKALEALMGLELTNEGQVEILAIEAAKSIKKLDPRSKIWDSEYSKFLKIQQNQIIGVKL